MALEAVPLTFLILVAGKTPFAIEGSIGPDIGMRIVAGEAREASIAKTGAAHQPHGLIADVNGRIGIAFRLIAMTIGAEFDESLGFQARRIEDGTGTIGVLGGARVASLA